MLQQRNRREVESIASTQSRPHGSGTRGPQFRQVTTTCWPSCCLLQPPNIVFNYWKCVFSRTNLIQSVGEYSYVVSGKRKGTKQPDEACLALYRLLHNECVCLFVVHFHTVVRASIQFSMKVHDISGEILTFENSPKFSETLILENYLVPRVEALC